MRKSAKVALATLGIGAALAVGMRVVGVYMGEHRSLMNLALATVAFSCMMGAFGLTVMAPGVCRRLSAALDMTSTALFIVVALLEEHPVVAGLLLVALLVQTWVHAKLIGLVRYVPRGGAAPGGYGLVMQSQSRDGGVYAIKPLHVVIRFALPLVASALMRPLK